MHLHVNTAETAVFKSQYYMSAPNGKVSEMTDKSGI